jgi:hypothetical protein
VPAVDGLAGDKVDRGGAGAIRIEIAGAVVHAERGVDLDWLRDVLCAVKAAR